MHENRVSTTSSASPVEIKFTKTEKYTAASKFTFMPQKYPPARQKAYFIKFHGDPSKHCEDISLI